MNECNNENGGNNCSSNGACTNVPGSFTCACNANYFGNGVTCICISLRPSTFSSPSLQSFLHFSLPLSACRSVSFIDRQHFHHCDLERCCVGIIVHFEGHQSRFGLSFFSSSSSLSLSLSLSSPRGSQTQKFLDLLTVDRFPGHLRLGRHVIHHFH